MLHLPKSLQNHRIDMKLIQPNCRIQFTAEDVQFISDTLARKDGDRSVLVELLSDADTRDAILDDEKIFTALLEHRGCLRVSNRLYFFVIVRNVLRRAGIDDRDVADYTAELLAEYSDFEQTRCRVPGQESPLDYFFEMIAALQNADERTSFYLRAHIGNHSLFLSGIFPQRIRYRAEKRGFPDLRYYEALGQTSFRIASDHRLASRYDLAPIYATLSERFHAARQALNDMSERIVSLGDMDAGLDALLLGTMNKPQWS
jgi:hypothetical protein